MRRAQPADLPLLAALLEQLSDQTRYLRYCHPRPGSRDWARSEADRLARQGGSGAQTLIAVTRARRSAEAIGIGELAWGQGAAAVGELAMLVRDDRQGLGVGTALGHALIAQARERGIAELHAHLLPENQASLRLLRRLGVAYATTFDGELLHIVIQLAAPRRAELSAVRDPSPRPAPGRP